MRIAQIVLPSASAYERKSQRADHAALARSHEVTVATLESIAEANADIAHVYAGKELPSSAFVGFPIPYVASADLPPSRWRLRKPVKPRFVLSPIAEEPVPESVEDQYFENVGAIAPRDPAIKIVGTFDRTSTRNMVEQTLARIRRFRDDVTWQLYGDPPTPEDLAGVDVWVDPVIALDDFDGFVAEALVVGLPVVASRTPINALRLEQGRTGFLAPPADPNELAHAILAALFKPEGSRAKQLSAKQTVSKFRARQRLRILTQLYERSKTR